MPLRDALLAPGHPRFDLLSKREASSGATIIRMIDTVPVMASSTRTEDSVVIRLTPPAILMPAASASHVVAAPRLFGRTGAAGALFGDLGNLGGTLPLLGRSGFRESSYVLFTGDGRMPLGIAIDASALLAFEAYHVRGTFAVEPLIGEAGHRGVDSSQGREDGWMGSRCHSRGAVFAGIANGG